MEKIKEPTKEQIEEFWKWCGFQRHFGGEWFYERYKSTNAWWESPDGRKYKDLPPIDLNNLFTVFFSYRWKSILHDWIESLTGNYEKDTLLLFAQLYAIIKEK